MDILSVVLKAVSGLISLLFGRRFFWLFLAIVGFIGGFFFGALLFPDSGAIIHILLGLVLGVVGALLSQVAPVAIAAIIGFFAGGFTLLSLVKILVDPAGFFTFLIVLIGGAIGVFLVVKFFDLALVILSSMAGATALTSLGNELVSMNNVVQLIVYVVLAILGIAFQLSLIKPHEGE